MEIKTVYSTAFKNEFIKDEEGYRDYLYQKLFVENIRELSEQLEFNKFYLIRIRRTEEKKDFHQEIKQMTDFGGGAPTLNLLWWSIGRHLDKEMTKKKDVVYLVYAYWLHGGTDMENADSDEKLLKVFKNLEEARKFGKKYKENHNVTNINIRSEEVR